MIVATDCDVCSATRKHLVEIGKSQGVNVVLDELNFEKTDDAIDLAIDYDINDIPSFIINQKVFIGPDHADEDILEAMKNELRRP